MTTQLRVYVPPHPLIKHWLGVVRDKDTPTAIFRSGIKELGRWLTYEATQDWLPTFQAKIQTPLAECDSTFINPEIPMVVVPVLRAGLALLEGAQDLVPLASVYHIGMARNEETLEPRCYLNKFPAQFAPQTHVLLLDPMLATGGTIMATLAELVQRGIDPALIRIVAVVVAPPALKRLNATYPALKVYTAIIDERLNDVGYIVPGLGDAGDRAFGT